MALFTPKSLNHENCCHADCFPATVLGKGSDSPHLGKNGCQLASVEISKASQ